MNFGKKKSSSYFLVRNGGKWFFTSDVTKMGLKLKLSCVSQVAGCNGACPPHLLLLVLYLATQFMAVYID